MNFSQVFMIGILIKVVPESVVLKKIPIVSFMILHSDTRVHKSINQQSPITMIFPEINRCIHCLHTSFVQPVLCNIKEFKSCIFIINTLEKTHSAGWLSINRSIIFLKKSGNSSYQIAICFIQYPACSLSSFKIVIFLRIKYAFNLNIRGTYPKLITFIKQFWNFQKVLFMFTTYYFCHFHFLPDL